MSLNKGTQPWQILVLNGNSEIDLFKAFDNIESSHKSIHFVREAFIRAQHGLSYHLIEVPCGIR